MSVLSARSSGVLNKKCEEPKDFLAAHEPVEQLLYHFRKLHNKLLELKDLKTDSQESNDETKKYELLIRFQEFLVQQIKEAHIAREKEI
ncbi:MAG: hypothetical protein PVJ20_11045 [Desulfobacterales bacterium]|jgi:hypothetical protein